MKKRKWAYILPPAAYEITCDVCGGPVEWSEYEGRVWCKKCGKDVKGTGGIFNVPVPIQACEFLGISFDRVDLATGRRLYMKVKDDKCVWEEKE